MVARTIGEVRKALADDRAGKAFASGFAEAYFGQAFGVLPKTEIDLLVFRLLIETGVIDGDGSIFAMAAGPKPNRKRGCGWRRWSPLTPRGSRPTPYLGNGTRFFATLLQG
ncbi:hypothetical protein [Sphingomonas sp. NPDC079357]|uniref:hypothetical protein n=1 Tax=Sphingomonas sp. NPDC079357 TaxID=3364518 RepID=UPI00384D8A27